MSDDPSLSEHEQRVFAEIERQLLADDPDLAKRVREPFPRRTAIRILRLSILSMFLGLGLLLAFAVSVWLGLLGFLLMLGGGAGMAMSIRQMTASGRPAASVFRDALRRAESRIRDRRPEG